jgi:hypothetical protein
MSSFEDVLRKTHASDFDGHTDFARLTSEQRIEWLSNAAQFWYAVHPVARENTRTTQRERRTLGASVNITESSPPA